MGKTKRKSSQSQSLAESITPLLAPIRAVQNLLDRFNDRGVIVGGVAASLLGTPRYTVDLDALLLMTSDDIPKILELASQQGILPRIPDAINFATKNRVLLLRHSNSGTDIDLIMGMLPFEIEMIERSKLFEIGSIRLRLPTPEDLIIMKSVAHRPKDLADIQAIAESHPGLDKALIQNWVQQFADALDLPDLWMQISQLL